MSQHNPFSSTTSSPSDELELLRQLVEKSPDGSHILDENGNLMYCSETFAALLGYTMSETRNLHVEDWDRHFPTEQIVPVIKDLIQTPRIFVTRHQRKNGDIFDAEINARGISIDGKLYLYASSRDITLLKRDAIEHQKTNAKLQFLFDTMPDAFFVINQKGLIQSVNEKGIAMFGYSEEALIGKNISMLTTSEHRQAHDGYISEYLKTGKNRIIGSVRELIARKSDGSEFPIALSVGEVRVDDEVLFTGIIRDISELKQKEKDLIQAKNEALEAGLAKSQFLANMSHEIRTPLNGIFGVLQVLKQKIQGSEKHALIDVALSSGRSLLTVINDILDFSKIEAGMLKVDHTALSIRNIIESIISELTPQASQNGNMLTFCFSESFDDGFEGDPVRIKQILLNLTSNAIKFTENGQVNIAVEHSHSDHLEGVRFVVTDTGIGMSEELLKRLFNRFEQADESTTRKHGGTGLGLAICKNLIELMDGKITVSSSHQTGSEFIVTLPLPKAAKSPTPLTDSISQVTPDFSSCTILVAEDNEINQVVITSMLEPTGARFVIASDGQEAINLAQQHQPDLILMDIQMPNVDGIEACKKIKARTPEQRIIALTANVMAEQVREYENVGFDESLGKPIPLDALYSTLIRYLPSNQRSV